MEKKSWYKFQANFLFLKNYYKDRKILARQCKIFCIDVRDIWYDFSENLHFYFISLKNKFGPNYVKMCDLFFFNSKS